MAMSGAAQSVIVDLPADEGVVALSSLDLSKGSTGWGAIQANKSVDGNPLTLKDTIYTSGVGMHATGQLTVRLNSASRFVARIGIDDEVRAEVAGAGTKGTADYRICLKAADGATEIAAQGTVRSVDAATPLIDIDCQGYKYLILEANEGADGNTCDHVDWANAYFLCQGEDATPPAMVTEDEAGSRLVGATTVYAQPGVRFMQKLRPVAAGAAVRVDGLPDGLTWNARRSLVEGIVEKEGTYTYTASVTEDGETTTEDIRLTVSSSLQQPVPLMGWLSWNVFEEEISDDKVRAVADAFEKYGLRDAGYRYLCLDDLWHAAARDAATGRPLYDTAKFPHGLKALADYVHGKGLKFGIYSDAAEKTCAGAYGSYGYEEIDAKQYAEWGFDLLKYDYCGAPTDQLTARQRYQAMGDALKASGRDILFYMCEWGQRKPWLWGAQTGATTWRCTYDTRDGWTGADGGVGVTQSIEGMKDLWPYSGPNRFNDADMMCVGLHGKGKSSNDYVSGTPGMTQTEYRTQFSLWCMWASPLTLSFDVRHIDDDDLAIITNEELIAVNQDRMGLQAELIGEKNNVQTYMKDLENGDVAVALVNLGDWQRVTLDFATLPALDPGKAYILRDLWQKKNLDQAYTGTFNVLLQRHETKVYRLTPAESSGLARSATTGTSAAMTVAAGQDKITLKCPGTKGQRKRVLISDLSGHVVASANSTDTAITLPLTAPKGVYVANVVCAGRSQSVKFTF